MSVRINLLPHREERRKRQRQRFAVLAGSTFVAALAVAGVVHLTVAGMIDAQTSRNEFLKRENAQLDKEIAEIKKLKEDIAALLARKQIIETLQTDRSQSVHLLDELVRQTPDGVYLRAIKQEGLKVNVLGYAQSNARVSTYMRNIQASPYLENPTLVEIKAAMVNNRRVSDFNLNLQLKRPQAPAKPGAPLTTAQGTTAQGTTAQTTAQGAMNAASTASLNPARPTAMPTSAPVPPAGVVAPQGMPGAGASAPPAPAKRPGA